VTQRESTALQDQADQLGEQLLGLMRAVRSFDSSEQVCCGVTMSQCHALVAFGQSEEIAMAELANRLGLALSTATRIADSLVRVGLAERRRPADDRRVVLLRLTRAGRERADAIQVGRRQILAEVIAEIPEEHRQELTSLLGHLLGAMRSMSAACCERG
jgi:DNA-binding MarR family transcriptional regulator